MKRNDRYVHATLADGREAVRYDVAGHWYLERPDGLRERISFLEAVEYALGKDAKVHLELPGGGRFDAAMRRAGVTS